jgi:uncharacterized membrane protein YbhN (UPF0104 family)
MKRLVQALAALILLWLVIRNVDMAALANTFGKVRLQSLGMAVAIFFLSCGLAASKWRLLWQKATWWQLLNANFASQLYSLILPGQLAGEVVKTFRVGRQFADTTAVAASVVMDRATGLVGLLLLACAGALISRSAVAHSVLWLLALATIAILCVLYAIAYPSIRSAAYSASHTLGVRYRWLERVSAKAVAFMSAWATLVSKPRTTAIAVCLGIAYQVMCVGVNVIIARDLGIEIALADWCWVFGLVAIALLLPLTLAGLGVREGTYAGLLGLLGVPIEKAVAVSILVFAISLLGAVAGAAVELAALIRVGARPGS